MENNNGKGIFYGVIGVATLIVAIIGATFAYFTATTQSGQYVTGMAATAGLSVNVTRLTTFSSSETGKDKDTASYIMVPQLDATLDQAIIGVGTETTVEDPDGGEPTTTTTYTPCIDANGSLVCTIYKITVTNTGTSAIDISGRIDFYTGELDKLTVNGEDNKAVTDGASVMNHLKWARLTNPEDVSGLAVPTTLLDYATDTEYAGLSPVGANLDYKDKTMTPYLYGRAVTSDAKDLYGSAYTGPSMSAGAITAAYVNSHQAHYDLLDPTDDLTKGTWTTNNTATMGQIHLLAKGTNVDANDDKVMDDTATLYIVVWISENLAAQNEVDKGTFVGQVTFNSADGSGATSSFTEIASNGEEEGN